MHYVQNSQVIHRLKPSCDIAQPSWGQGHNAVAVITTRTILQRDPAMLALFRKWVPVLVDEAETLTHFDRC